MHRRHFIATAAAGATAAAAGASMLGLGRAAAAQAPRLSGPYAHENLALYFVSGPSVSGPVPLTS